MHVAPRRRRPSGNARIRRQDVAPGRARRGLDANRTARWSARPWQRVPCTTATSQLARSRTSGDLDVIDHFGDAEAELAATRTGAGLIDLAHVSVAELSGEEVRRWCHGMFTNHVKRLRPGQGNRHAMCNDRGGVLGVLDLYCIADDRFLAVFEASTPTGSRATTACT